MTALAYVRSTLANTTTTSTTLSAPASALTAGNHVFVWVGYISAASVGFTVSDTAGNTYTAVTAPTVTGSDRGQWFYVLNATGSASNVVTVTAASSLGVRYLRVIEVSGSAPTVAAATAFDSSGTATKSEVSFDVGVGGMVLWSLLTYSTAFVGNSTAYQSDRDTLTLTRLADNGNYSANGYGLAPTGAVRHVLGTSSTPSVQLLMALVLDVGGTVPTGVTSAKLSQAAAEALRRGAPKAISAQIAAEAVRRGAPKAISAQIVVEVARRNIGTSAVFSQLAVEVLRKNDASSAARPQVFVCT